MSQDGAAVQEPQADVPPVAPPRSLRAKPPRNAAIILVVAIVLVYLGSFRGVFIFDDIPNVVESPLLRTFDFSAQGLHDLCSAMRPLNDATFVLNYRMSGLWPIAFHATNLLVHVLAALALFGLVRQTLLTAPLRPRWGPHATGLAMAIALLWSLHPLCTEAVTYISQRSEAMAALFYLLTLYCLARGRHEEQRRLWHVAAVAACALGMGCKLTMVTAPLAALLYDRCFLSDSFGKALRRAPLLFAGLALTWTIPAVMLAAFPLGPTAGQTAYTLSWWQYAMTQPMAIAQYLRLSVWPVGQCLDYGWPAATAAWQIAAPLALLAAIGGLIAWAGLRGRRGIVFAGVAFFLVLAPTSSLMPIKDVIFEHRMYLPLAALVATVVMLTAGAWRRLRGDTSASRAAADNEKTTALVALAVLAAALGYLTWERNRDYESPSAIWRSAVTASPFNARACVNLGESLRQEGKLAEAVLALDRAIELEPTPEAYLDRAAARGQLAAAMLKAPAYQQAAKQELRLALADCTRAIDMQPTAAKAYANRAMVYGVMSGYDDSYLPQAISDLSYAIGLERGHGDWYVNRASFYIVQKDFARAKEDLRRARQFGGYIPPGMAEAVEDEARGPR